ncbi:MAG: hypothetical protein FJ202_10170 [Gemmatimonadetes bacterium]|nr:hypothetical protein [Gemmatimonadota bacterium]
MRSPVIAITCVALALWCASGLRPAAQSLPAHPSLLFDDTELDAIRTRAGSERMLPVYNRLIARANVLLTASPLLVSTTGRGQPDPPGTRKGLSAARVLQGRVFSFAMAFLLTGQRAYRDAAVAQLDHAITNWPIWVDTAHQPPYDLMTGEVSLTFGLAYDWLYPWLTDTERRRLREGVEQRALAPYLKAVDSARPMYWFHTENNWNPVCNGGAVVLALALRGESALSSRVLELAVPAMAYYWNNLGDDGGWEEGTGYWTYGHRYAFIAADALRRAGRAEGTRYLQREGARQTGMFPLVFNPGTRLSASFSDSAGRASDPLFYFLGREYLNPDYIWFQDRTPLRSATSEGWPEEAMALIWRPVDEAWLPETYEAFRPTIPAVTSFPSIGWAMLASEQPDPPVFLAFKNGSLAAPHSHLDLNHVTVGMGNNMVLIDLGSRPYPADYFSATARPNYYEISTAGHNAVLVGGRGQLFGRTGTLQGPYEGEHYSAFLGNAGGSYQVSTPRARRHVVFVDRRYYVLLDEVAPQTAQTIELRFHTYGTVTASPQGTVWTVNQSGSQVDVAPASSALVRGTIETPSGWIRAVNLLRLATPQPLSSLTLATALVPRLRAGATVPQVSQQVHGDELLVTVDGDQVTFRQTSDGYVLSDVTIVQRP